MRREERYLLLIEFDETGLVIDSYDCLLEAEVAMKEVFNHQQHYMNRENVAQHYTGIKLLSYTVHATGKYFIPYKPTGSSNGFFTAYIFDTQSVKDFSLQQFISERMNTIYAFDVENYDTGKATFVREALIFIAN